MYSKRKEDYTNDKTNNWRRNDDANRCNRSHRSYYANLTKNDIMRL